MPTYESEQYDLHAMKYRVEVATEGEAIAKLFRGEAEPADQGQEFIEVAEDFGLPADENAELVEALRKLGVSVDGAVLPSIRSIEKV
jgi:hypothetical protein